MRSRMSVLAAVVLAGAVVELVLLGVVIWWIGVAWTAGLLLAKALIGYLLVRRVGRRGWRQFRGALDAGRPPGREVTVAAVGVVGAMLVLLAGFIGAVLGAVALTPPVRRSLAGLAERLVERRISAAAAGDIFGPRRVRVRRAPPSATGADPGAAGDATYPAKPADPAHRPASAPQAGAPPAIEGEILPPR